MRLGAILGEQQRALYRSAEKFERSQKRENEKKREREINRQRSKGRLIRYKREE